MDLFLTCSVIQTPQIVPIIPGSNIHVLSIMSLDNPPPSSQNLLQDQIILFSKNQINLFVYSFFIRRQLKRERKRRGGEKKREAAAEIEREIEREREKKEREGEGERER